MRDDLQLISDWIPQGATLLDLGCGDGTLLAWLGEHKQTRGYGLEINQDNLAACFEKGVNVLEQDLDAGLGNFQDGRFDYVVMTQALQAMRYPHLVLDEMLRIGHQCIVTFPNFGNWRARTFLLTHGRMPVTNQLSYQWYDTPNIHFCTVQDFEVLCAEKNIRINHREFVAERFPDRQIKGICPNLFSDTAIYLLSK